MALRHRQHPIVGLQFHPESVLTPYGKQILKNFITPPSIDYSHRVYHSPPVASANPLSRSLPPQTGPTFCNAARLAAS